jgi:hypothetical protein
MDPDPISYILLSPVYFTRTVYFTRILLLFSTRYAHTLCFKQTGEIDNLIICWELVVLCAGSTLPLAKQSLDKVPYKLSGAVAKLAGITFRRLAFSYWIDNLGFLLREKLAAIFIKPSLGVSQLAGHLLHQLHTNKFSGTIHHRAIKQPCYNMKSNTNERS